MPLSLNSVGRGQEWFRMERENGRIVGGTVFSVDGFKLSFLDALKWEC
jgi:hypothetical protein